MKIVQRNASHARSTLTFCACLVLLSSCAMQPIENYYNDAREESISKSEGHINEQNTPEPATAANNIPAPVSQSVFVRPPEHSAKLETYSVSVQDIPVRDLLFALARDAKLNLDIKGNIPGNITLNAIDQTLPRILSRIANQADLRFQLQGNHLSVEEDTPFLKTYHVDYVNIDRVTSSTITTSTGIDNGLEDGSSGNSGDNTSLTSIQNTSNNLFWRSLTTNLEAILNENGTSDSSSPAAAPAATSETADTETTASTSAAASEASASSAPATSVIANRESGIVYIRATERQHKAVQAFLDEVMSSSRRQVLIEATIAEITLNNQHQMGVDWSTVATDLNAFSLSSTFLGSQIANPPTFALGYTRNGNDRSASALMRALEQYGTVKVLSSPKLMALNNQTAILKVVDNRIYFTFEVDEETNEETNVTTRTVDYTVHQVPIGFIMNVTPFISQNEEIILNMRPTVTRILDFVSVSIPVFNNAGIENSIPEVQIREMESVLRLQSGQTAVLGGLMQDSSTKDRDAVPLLGKLPFIGQAFRYDDDARTKTELVIFLKPTLINNADINQDMKSFRRYLPRASNDYSQERTVQ